MIAIVEAIFLAIFTIIFIIITRETNLIQSMLMRNHFMDDDSRAEFQDNIRPQMRLIDHYWSWMILAALWSAFIPIKLGIETKYLPPVIGVAVLLTAAWLNLLYDLKKPSK